MKDDIHTGYVSGPDDKQFYQTGYRNLNGDGALHAPIDPKNALQEADTPPPPPPPSAATPIGITPTGDGMNCIANDQGGWLAHCWELGNAFGDDEDICTSDTTYYPADKTRISYCKASGGKCDPNGLSTMEISTYCKVAEYASCAIVIASELEGFGAGTGSTCIKWKDVKNIIGLEQTTDGCGGPPEEGRIGMISFNNRASTVCLAGSLAPGLCAA